MSALPTSDRVRDLAGPTASRDRNGGRTPRPIAFAATLVLAALTGLPRASAANLIPQPDDPSDPSDPFLGL